MLRCQSLLIGIVCLFVGTVPVRAVQPVEPIACGETKSGEISSPGEIDSFTFNGEVGELVEILTVGTGGGLSPADACWRLINPEGTMVTEQQCGAPLQLELARTGTYTVEVYDPPYQNETGSYALSLDCQKACECSSTNPIAFGETKSGELAGAIKTDCFTFNAEGGELAYVGVVGTGGEGCSPQDGCWKLAGPDGLLLTGQVCRDPREVQLVDGGPYTIRVFDRAHNDPCVYDVSLTQFNCPDLITNGSFETGPDPGFSYIELPQGSTSVTGWTVTQAGVDYAGGAHWPAAHGDRSLGLDDDPDSLGAIAQSFPTVAGQRYLVVFDMAGNWGGVPAEKKVRVSAAGQSQDFTFDCSCSSNPNLPVCSSANNMWWEQQRWTFIANSTITTLQFENITDPGTYGPALDNVSVRAEGCAPLPQQQCGTTLIGPVHYHNTAPSPFSCTNGFSYFHLEDFEDHQLNTPGVSVNAEAVACSQSPDLNTCDSVDSDDGVIDSLCVGCDSLFVPSGLVGFTFTFNAEILGDLPTHVGIVWTDTDGFGSTTFEAFDAAGNSLRTIGPVNIADDSFSGATLEDHFFGVIHPGGISQVKVTNNIANNTNDAGLEVDHLQYGFRPASVSEGSETFYRDADEDGYGNPANSVQGCSPPAGYVANNTDCDDGNASIHPNTAELCNGVDDDCDGSMDEGLTVDADGDGFSPPPSCAGTRDDCDDSNAAIHPGATELCGDGIDQDCSGSDLVCSAPDLTGNWLSHSQVCRTVGGRQKCTVKGKFREENIGELPAGKSKTQLFLSDDPLQNAGDQLLKTSSVPALLPGQTKTISLSKALAPSVNASGKYLIACVDAVNVVVERSETNNCVSSGPIP